jgi:predicted RNase H-like nuclease (RuvC/YqgF family)
MTLHSFVARLTQLFSWLYYQHQWEEWELLAIAGAALVPLLLIARLQRKERIGRIYTHHGRERSSIIGIKLADGKRGQAEVTDSKKNRLGFPARNKNKRDATKEADSSNEQIRQLQCQITKHQEVEARLEQQLAELTAANEKLQHEMSEMKQAEGHPRRQALDLLGANKAPPESLNRPDQDTHMLRENPKHPTDSRRTNEPLDIEKLKVIAALARQIQERPRPELRQTEPQTSE